MSAKFRVKLAIDRGASFSKEVTWKSGASVATVTPVDLTGCIARMQIRSEITSEVILATFTTENGGIILGGTAGTIKYAIMTAAESAALIWTTGVYDLEIEFLSGLVVRKIFGPVTVSPEVTR